MKGIVSTSLLLLAAAGASLADNPTTTSPYIYALDAFDFRIYRCTSAGADGYYNGCVLDPAVYSLEVFPNIQGSICSNGKCSILKGLDHPGMVFKDCKSSPCTTATCKTFYTTQAISMTPSIYYATSAVGCSTYSSNSKASPWILKTDNYIQATCGPAGPSGFGCTFTTPSPTPTPRATSMGPVSNPDPLAPPDAPAPAPGP